MKGEDLDIWLDIGDDIKFTNGIKKRLEDAYGRGFHYYGNLSATTENAILRRWSQDSARAHETLIALCVRYRGGQEIWCVELTEFSGQQVNSRSVLYEGSDGEAAIQCAISWAGDLGGPGQLDLIGSEG